MTHTGASFRAATVRERFYARLREAESGKYRQLTGINDFLIPMA